MNPKLSCNFKAPKYKAAGMSEIPSHKEIPVEILSSIFNDTTNSYKFYWFLSIIDIIQTRDADEILINEIIERMIESVWYPLSYFKLSFGKQDSFKDISDLIYSYINEPHSAESIIHQFKTKANKLSLAQFESKKKDLSRWVPYRFIRPFYNNDLRGISDHLVNRKIIELSTESSKKNPNSIPYYFSENKIIINPPWKIYLRQNCGLIKGFTIWALVKFVQKNNPNVLGVPGKLFKPEKRNLILNTSSWNYYFRETDQLQCIYSKTPVPVQFSLDHFVPWSYTVHDLNWNILPVSKEINSSKSNNLPSLEEYLKGFVALQRDFISTIYKSSFEQKAAILEHYCILFNDNSKNIFEMPKQQFDKKIIDTIQPMVQIAHNMGFNKNWIYNSK